MFLARPRPSAIKPCRRDGWTPKRQLRFLEVLLLTRSVTTAARTCGMSRESAHRLRSRDPHGLFALAWDRALAAGRVTLTRVEVDQGHTRVVATGLRFEGRDRRLNPAERSTS